MLVHNRYSFIHSLIHWLMACLIIALLATGYIMDDMPNGSEKYQLLGWHKSLGLLTLFLIVIRIITRMQSDVTHPPSALWETMVRKVTHSLLYLLMIIMPLSGAIMSWSAGYPIKFFSLFTIPGSEVEITSLASIARSFHFFTAYGLVILIALHLGAFLFKQFIKKEDIISRISLRR